MRTAEIIVAPMPLSVVKPKSGAAVDSATQHGTRRIGFAHPPPRIISRIRFAHLANRRQMRIGFVYHPSGETNTNRIRLPFHWWDKDDRV